MATGRSDYPNQVNNVLGFPFIFRGALDVRARAINEADEDGRRPRAGGAGQAGRAGVGARGLRRREVHASGREYIIPKPFDPRVLLWVAPAVAKAAMDSGVARVKLDLDEYRERLRKRQSRTHTVMRTHLHQGRKKLAAHRLRRGRSPAASCTRAPDPREEASASRSCSARDDEDPRADRGASTSRISTGVTIINPHERAALRRATSSSLWALRQRKGVTPRAGAAASCGSAHYFGAHDGEHGRGRRPGDRPHHAATPTPSARRCRSSARAPAGAPRRVHRDPEERLQVLRRLHGEHRSRRAEELAEIAVHDRRPGALLRRRAAGGDALLLELRLARGTSPEKVRHATRARARARSRTWRSTARCRSTSRCSRRAARRSFPFTTLKDEANVLVFPNLDAGEHRLQAAGGMAGAEVIGPVLLGMNKPVNVLQMDSSVQRSSTWRRSRRCGPRATSSRSDCSGAGRAAPPRRRIRRGPDPYSSSRDPTVRRPLPRLPRG